MRYPEKSLAFTAIATVGLFIAATLSYRWLFDILVPPVDGAIYDVTIFTSPFKQSLFFACICGAIPILCIIIWNKIPITNISKRIGSVILLVGSVVGATLIRRYFFRSELISVTKENESFRLNARVPKVFDNFNMEYWMMVGLMTGVILTIVFFRKKQHHGRKKTHRNIQRKSSNI